MKIDVETFFDQKTNTLTYIVYSPDKADALIIDPVLDFDFFTSTISTSSVEKVLNFIKEKKLNLKYVLETHAHADHLSAAAEIKSRFPQVVVAINKNISKVQKVFSGVFNLKNMSTQGEQFDHLLEDNETIELGSFCVKTIFTPGHTPACSSFLIEDMVFVGDALFMPDSGTGRCDFPEGSAKDMYHSIHERLYSLKDETKVFVGHDYQVNGRELMYQTTIAESKKENIQLNNETTEEEYIQYRSQRDSSLSAPKLLLPSIQVNINAGQIPTSEDNGTSYLKLPLKLNIGERK